MYNNEQIAEEIGVGSIPSYFQLAAFAWRAYIKYGNDKCDLPSEKRLMKAADTIYSNLELSDRELLSFYGDRQGLPNDALAGYSYETNISRSEIRTRFNWLCYRLAVQAGIISSFSTIPPPEHYKERKKE